MSKDKKEGDTVLDIVNNPKKIEYVEIEQAQTVRSLEDSDGAGGLGSTAVIYGYQNFDDTILYGTVLLLIIFVQAVQVIGGVAYRHAKRKGS